MKRFLPFALLLLTACGFEPVYGTHDSKSAGNLPGITVETSEADLTQHRLAQLFSNHLEDLLASSGTKPAEYTFKAVLSETDTTAAVSPDGTISRYNMLVRVTMTLTRLSDGKDVYRDQAQRIGSYDNIATAFFSTYISSQDAVKRASTELAEDVNFRLIAFFKQHPHPEALPPLPTKPGGGPSAPPAPPLSTPSGVAPLPTLMLPSAQP